MKQNDPKRRKRKNKRPQSVEPAPKGGAPAPRHAILGLAAVAVVIPVVWWMFFSSPTLDKQETGSEWHDKSVVESPSLAIQSPLDGSLFPPDLAPPRFFWEDGTAGVDVWTVGITFANGEASMQFACPGREWTPSAEAWEQIKAQSLESEVRMTVCGVNQVRPDEVLSQDEVSIRTSGDEVGAPIFYREVNLPFIEAVKDPAAHIRWRFGAISSDEQPPVVMEHMPLCGNCHSFSSDGALIGMDVDYGNDKGSYVLSPVSQEMVYYNAKIITWSDYHPEDNRGTLGLLSQVSPDGRYVISTVKDRSVFAPVDRLAFSQLFFPIQGILAYYDRETKEFHALPGADDSRYVQSNATWSPDGKYIVFARNEAYHSKALSAEGRGLTRAEDIEEFLSGQTTFKFDLWRIPFNDGKGGKAEPLRGASNNGESNYFAKYSPDGKWIVFCRARSFMLLQPDSALYIIPAEGGEARRMECNTNRMNSWHSWSPNGKWIVFSSKTYSPYTQLFLTHIDEEGNSSPAVLLSHFTSDDMAANIPEFVNTTADGILSIRSEFIDDHSYLQAGKWNVRDGNYDQAVRDFQNALKLNPDNHEARVALGSVLLSLNRLEEAEKHFEETLSRDATNQDAGWLLGALYEKRGDSSAAMKAYQQALEIDPENAAAHQALGRLALKTGSTSEGRKHLLEAARLDPEEASAYMDLGNSYLREQNVAQAIALYRRALERAPDSDSAMVALAMTLLQSPGRSPQHVEEAVRLGTRACEVTGEKSPPALIILAEAHAAAGRLPEAVSVAIKALDAAQRAGREDLAAAARSLLQKYGQQTGTRMAP